MTKYSKVKKLMKETGLAKKEATKLLRDNRWKYDDALQTYQIRRDFGKVDFAALLRAVAEAVERLRKMFLEFAECISEAFSHLRDEKIGGDDCETDAGPADTV